MDPSERDGGSRKSNKPKCNFYSPTTLSFIFSAKAVFQEIVVRFSCRFEVLAAGASSKQASADT
jgi:hypothetical protein